MDSLWMLLPVVILAVLFAAVWPFRKVTIYEYERGLKYSRGKFVSVLGPGEYRVYKHSVRVDRVDIRPRAVTVPGQEVLSSDGVTLKASVAAVFEIVDPAAAVNKVQSYYESFYLALQVALREIIGSAKIEDVMAKRSELGTRLSELATPEVEKLGLRLVSASIKDIMLPGDLKRIFSNEVKARHEGLAALEKARGETAALRNLANAAKMVESNPALMQLRMMHSMGESSGNTFVVGMPPGVVPVPRETKPAPVGTVEEEGSSV